MLPFLLSAYRRKNVEWLMDRYTEVVARYPNATVSYIGHSNGTYLLAKALELNDPLLSLRQGRFCRQRG